MSRKKETESEQEIMNAAPEEGKASAHPFREMIEVAGEGFYETDTDGNLRGFNNAFCQVLGYTREEIQDRNFTSFMDEGSARRLQEAMNRVWVSHQGFSNLVWEIKDRHGRPRVIEFSVYLMKNHAGQKMGLGI